MGRRRRWRLTRRWVVLGVTGFVVRAAVAQHASPSDAATRPGADAAAASNGAAATTGNRPSAPSTATAGSSTTTPAPATSPPSSSSSATSPPVADSPAIPPGARPASLPSPLTYDEIADRAAAAVAELADTEKQTQAKLKALAGVAGKEADAARRDLLVKRRLVDRQAWLTTRRLKLYWLERSLPEANREVFRELSQEEADALLDARTIQQRLAVPLPPKQFAATPLEEVLRFIEDQSDAGVVADWPALTKVGVSKIDVVTLEVGRYDKPARETLTQVLAAVGRGQALLDLSFPDTVLISTKDGLARVADLDKLLASRVADGRSWTQSRLRSPGSFTEVPLEEALEAAIGTDLTLEVQWDRLAEAGIQPTTPVSLTLGVHRVGHALAGLADVLSATPANRQKSKVVFDRTPEGVTVLTTEQGLAETIDLSGRLAAAARTDEKLTAALAARLPQVNLDGVRLNDLVTTVRNETAVDLQVNWLTLARLGLTQATPVSLHLANAPVSQVLRLMFTTPPGRPTVQWIVEGGRLIATGADR